MERATLVRENARLAREFRPMTGEDMDTLRTRIRPHARLELEWYKQD